MNQQQQKVWTFYCFSIISIHIKVDDLWVFDCFSDKTKNFKTWEIVTDIF